MLFQVFSVGFIWELLRDIFWNSSRDFSQDSFIHFDSSCYSFGDFPVYPLKFLLSIRQGFQPVILRGFLQEFLKLFLLRFIKGFLSAFFVSLSSAISLRFFPEFIHRSFPVFLCGFLLRFLQRFLQGKTSVNDTFVEVR